MSRPTLHPPSPILFNRHQSSSCRESSRGWWGGVVVVVVVKLTTHLHLVPRLRMGGVIPLLPINAFMV